METVVEDKSFHKYFKHISIPHEVWIYKGKVVGITASDYVNETNIETVLSGKTVNWPVKNDFIVYNGSQYPLFNLLSNKSILKSYSVMGGYLVNGKQLGHSGTLRDSVTKTIRSFYLNKSILEIYNTSWSKIVGFANLSMPVSALSGTNYIHWEVADRNKYITSEANSAEWLVKNGICYESVFPDIGQTLEELTAETIADLDRLLGLHVRWEKRKEKVWLLVRTSKIDKIKSKKTIGLDANGYSSDFNYKKIGNLVQLRDVSLSPLLSRMNQEEGNPYVFDETGYKGNVDLDINISSWNDLNLIRKALQIYDLDLKEEERLVDKLVFTETKNNIN